MQDVHKLRVFATVAQHLSFTRAAEALFLTQSAVSHQIAALEQEFSTPLLRREGRRVSLTDAGRVLAEHAARVFAALDEASDAVKRATKPGTGSLRIGASPAACQYLVPEALREFRESYPEYELSIAVGDSPQIAQQVLDGTIDLGLLIRTERDKRLAFHELFADELGFLVSPLHPWARDGKIDRRQIPDQHFVLYTRTSATFRIVEQHLLKLQSPLRKFMELGSMEAIKELVKLGLGISVVAPWIAAPEIDHGALVWLKMPGPPLRRHWAVACRATRHISIAEQTFLGLCRSAAHNLSLTTASAVSRLSSSH
ncbi:MAG TPA: LysR family transcriptional regulator [Phycisphaerae bacterium]|nr:LysR family transcriptional regulator [Phycisphaerae bacterium]